jgi:hypothetical protein
MSEVHAEWLDAHKQASLQFTIRSLLPFGAAWRMQALDADRQWVPGVLVTSILIGTEEQLMSGSCPLELFADWNNDNVPLALGLPVRVGFDNTSERPAFVSVSIVPLSFGDDDDAG